MLDCVVTGDYQTNTYILCDGGKAIVIDPGDDKGKIIKRLNELNADPVCVLITHGHFDHIRSVAALQKLGARVYMSEIEYGYLKAADFFSDNDRECVEPFVPDVLLHDGDEFIVLDHAFKTLLTPGHTPGGVCFFMDGKTVFTGDTLFKLSVGRWDFPLGDGARLVESLRKLFALDGDYTVYPGHGEATTLDYERRYNPYARI